MDRLSAATLGALPPDVVRPHYNRPALRLGIVHLGAGAFVRAHLAAATECTLHANHDLRWGIAGVSLRHADTRDALQPQDGLYTLALRDADDDGAPREKLQVVGAMPQLLVAAEAPGAVLDRIAHPDTRIVSLTVTEKGYHHDPASGALRLDDADIVHDITHPEAPRSTLGVLVHGLRRRIERGRGPLTLLSCDNLPHNGDTLRALVLGFAAPLDAPLHRWITAHCSFPNSMVDRIVPRTGDADRERIAGRLGLVDAAPVVAEPFFDRVVEDRFAAGRPAWHSAGARFVDDAAAFERLKLRMVNGSHSALAYLGLLAGLRTVDEALSVPPLRDYLDRLLRDEIAPTLDALPGVDLASYRQRLLQRFANPALQHATRQIAMDGSQKLPQRLLDTLRDRLHAGASITHLSLAVAAWVAHLRGVDERGRTFEIRDPLAGPLAQQLAFAQQAAHGIADRSAAEERRITVLCAFAPVFGALADDPRFVQAVARQSLSLRERGVSGALSALTRP
jgi:fructuronate reductase